ncbi:MAG: VIT1/CCC1 transporter family protein [Pirellulaceae bacterium]
MNSDLEHSHAPEDIAKRIKGRSGHSYLSDFIYGAIDGTVTTFAVVSSVAGAGLDYGIVVVLGLANLLGDGFSMAASNYLGTRTDQQLREKARAMEERHIHAEPEGEREEIRQIFAQKGFEGEDLERAVEIITSREERWIDTMLVDELGISLDGPNPFRAALTTFIAFNVVGVLPLLAFIFGLFVPVTEGSMYAASTVMTGIAFFLVGTAKSWFVDQRWYWSGLETLFVGGIAALLAYGVGMMLRGIVP